VAGSCEHGNEPLGSIKAGSHCRDADVQLALMANIFTVVF
jgi:hypothetical protein